MMTNCPPETTLRLLGTDAISEATFAELEGHVEQCLDCQRVLESALNLGPGAIRQTPPPALPGLVLEHELGRGGASRVYLAWEPVPGRHVAVKVFAKNPLIDPHAREHWLAEARALSRVAHDQVVSIYRVGESDHWLWLVLEYVPGRTLKDRLSEPLPARVAARLAETTARTVGYFHTRGLAHLDLKPSNILLGGDPGTQWDLVRPKISDFGIARLEGEPGMTETGANGPKGTPSYMAPEQVAGVRGTIGPAADIYALGALLYHMLTGRPPFQGTSPNETYEQVRNQLPVPPRRLNSRIPRDLETICLKCLEKVPKRRYPSAEAVANDLRLWLDGHPIKARRVSPVGHALRLCRRHPVVASLLVALGLTVTTAVVGLFVLLGKVEIERQSLAESGRRVQAHEKFSADTADHLVLYLRKVFANQRNTTSEEIEPAALKLRTSINELRGQGIVPSRAFGMFEEQIAFFLMTCNKREESRELFNQAAADLTQILARNPTDNEVRSRLEESLFYSGSLADEADSITALNYFEQAFQVGRALERGGSVESLLTLLFKEVWIFADRLGYTGQVAARERAQELCKQILARLLELNSQDSVGVSSVEPEFLRRLLKRGYIQEWSSQGGEGRIKYERVATEWLALSVDTISPFRSLAATTKFDRDPDAGAITLISTLRERCSNLGLPNSFECVVIANIIDDALHAAARQRRIGQLDGARATAARLMTLAMRLVREYPTHANSYRALSEAHDQVRKNAIQNQDENLVESSIVKAIDAAQRTLALNPDLVKTQRSLRRLTAELTSIKADRKTAFASLLQR